MQNPSIIVKNLVVKMQENTVLDGISFSLLPNEHLAILGASESGKTTLANALTGKIHFDGKVYINSADVTNMHTRIKMVEQRYSFKNLSGLSDFYYQQRFNSYDANDAPTIYEELLKSSSSNSKPRNNIDPKAIGFNLEVLGISHLKNSPLIQLSSGEHKRFQLVKALVNPPQVLLLDNPYTGLDIGAVKKLNNILKEISEKGTQVILIPGTFPIPDFITKVAFLKNKKLKFFGERKNFKEEEFSNSPRSNFFYNTGLLPTLENTSQNETIVEMKNIELKYGKHLIFRGLNWKIKEGEKWLLKGRNGSGKSSLLSMVTGDHPQAYSNEIYLFGKRRGSGESIWDIKKKIGFISPELHAFFDKNVSCFQAIGSGYADTIGLFKKLNQQQNNTILQWLDFLQLSHVSTKPLHSISASLQRMILLARALVKNPPLLVLDEPCQGLDEEQSCHFVSLVGQICAERNKTLIYVSHDEKNVPECVDNIFHLEEKDNQFYTIKKSAALAVA